MPVKKYAGEIKVCPGPDDFIRQQDINVLVTKVL